MALHRFVTTGDAAEFGRLGSRVLRRPITSVRTVPVEEIEAVSVPQQRSDSCDEEGEGIVCG
jgi:hypothetical protein